MLLNRRECLKAASLGTGGMLMAPLISQLTAQAAGDEAKLPRRFVFVVEGNGLPWHQIQPVGLERAKEAQRDKVREISLDKHKLPEALSPIENYKSKVSIIQGLSGKVAGGGHSCNFGALGCYNGRGEPRGETIDVALGTHLGGIFPHVGLGMVDAKKGQPAIVYNCSAVAKGKPSPTVCQPDVAHNMLFGSVAGGAGAQEFAAKSNVLDFLTDDLKKLQSQIGSAEKEKLDRHLEAYESLRQRQSRLEHAAGTLKKNAPPITDKYKSTVETDILDAQFDLAAASLIGGLTNCVTLSSGVGDLYFSVIFKGLGIDIGKHGIGHGGSSNGMDANQLGTKIRKFHFEQIARLMKKLEAVPEGSGTMLDNTCIVYMSDAAESHHSRCWEWPFVVIGDFGGKMKSGRYVEYPYWGKKNHRTIANLYTTLLNVAGDNRDYFGQADANLKDVDVKGALPELLA